MKKLTLKYKFLSFFVALIIVFSFLPVTPVQAAASTTSLETFAASLKKTDSTQLVGIFVKNVLAVKVVQQSSAAYVSSSSGTVTQFGMASQSVYWLTITCLVRVFQNWVLAPRSSWSMVMAAQKNTRSLRSRNTRLSAQRTLIPIL